MRGKFHHLPIDKISKLIVGGNRYLSMAVNSGLIGVIDFLKLLAPYQSVKVIVAWRKSVTDFQNMTTDHWKSTVARNCYAPVSRPSTDSQLS
jgi:hypothetical protein